MPSATRTIQPQTFADYQATGHQWITLASGDYYPDILPEACELYKPVLVMFGQLLRRSESSHRLLLAIAEVSETWVRIQLARVFRKYVSPEIPVEMLKKKTQAAQIVERFGRGFRPIQQVQAAFESRPMPDEALCAILWEYDDWGKKGYNTTERFFRLVHQQLSNITIEGPKPGKIILLGTLWRNYLNPERSVDFVLRDEEQILAIGLVHYDSDQNGVQENDHLDNYRGFISEIQAYAQARRLKTKIILLNEGPGLLFGSRWQNYAALEKLWPGQVLVITLRMTPERLTLAWLHGT